MDDMLGTYLSFVRARHAIWEGRQLGIPGPWTADPILRSHKFTNVFRVLDPGSQYIFTITDNTEPRDALARCLLYRLTNSIPAWEYARAELGRYPLAADFGPDLISIWQEWRARGETVFNPAYIVYPGHPGKPGVSGSDKITTVINRVNGWLASGRAEVFLSASTLEEQYTAIVSHPDLGEFTAMQVSTDFNYTAYGDDLEDTFIKAGPGAIRGAKRVMPRAKAEDVIRAMYEQVRSEPWCPTLELPDGELRRPSLMDVQNTLCEFSKFARYLDRDDSAGRPVYRPAHPGAQPEPRYPIHW